MESSNQHDYLLNSSIDQEVDQQELEQEQEYYMGGVGKSYECVYCKGGFNTAQALGGHMNIHRKDKLSSSRNKPNTTTHNLLTSTTTNKHEIHNNLSSATHDHVIETMDQKKSQENDLDLELRLGHDPLKQ
ncbi:hypothetical protein KY289_028715 [Solanum tuberosum]|nr:hypothetical protein KY289_028715 [Solanum tuberosum]